MDPVRSEAGLIDLGRFLFRLSLPLEISNRNDGRGHQWFRTDAEKKAVAEALQIFYPNGPPAEAREMDSGGTVNLVVRRILGKRQRWFDPDSILRGNAKEIVDAIVDHGFLSGDGYPAVGFVAGVQIKDPEAGPALAVDFFRAREYISDRSF